MSITFCINGEAPQVKVYCKDRFPNLDDDEFAGSGYERDENGLFFMESDWPEINWSNSNGYAMLRLMDMPVECCSSIEAEDLPDVRRTLVRLLNSEVPALRETVAIEQQPRIAMFSIGGTERVIQKGNCGFYDPGLLSEDVRERLERFLDLIMEAQEKGLGICWG